MAQMIAMERNGYSIIQTMEDGMIETFVSEGYGLITDEPVMDSAMYEHWQISLNMDSRYIYSETEDGERWTFDPTNPAAVADNERSQRLLNSLITFLDIDAPEVDEGSIPCDIAIRRERKAREAAYQAGACACVKCKGMGYKMIEGFYNPCEVCGGKGYFLPETRTVKVPLHDYHHPKEIHITLYWTCPKCGCKRGEPFEDHAYDGSIRLYVHGWRNPCGHLDMYAEVIKEARDNGLNEGLH